MFNRTSLQSHTSPVSVTGQSHDIFLTEQKFNPSGSIKSIHEDRENGVFLYSSFVEHRNRGRYRMKNQESTKWGEKAVLKNYFIKKVYDEKYLTHDIHIHKQ